MNPVLLHLTGLTLIHFIWQGAVVAGLLWVLLRLVPVRRADIRYGLALTALAALCVCPVATFRVLSGSEQGVNQPVDYIGTTTTQGGLLLMGGGVVGPMTAPPAQRLDLPTAMTLVWALGVFVLAVRLAAGLWKAHEVTRRRTMPAPDDWQERLAVLAEELGIKRSVKLIASELLDAPATVGVLRAVVLVPVSFLSKLPEDMVEALLLHELAHIRRHDYLLNVLQTVVETVLFYHPAVWWVSHVVRAERENCCDDIAVGATGDSASYAKALTMLEERRTMALTVSASGGHLMKRIRRILSINTKAEPAPAARPAALVVTIMALALAATVLANSGNKKPDNVVGPDVKIDKENPAGKADVVALAPPKGDIGSISQTVKESDYNGVPVPVVRFDVVPSFFQGEEQAKPGQAVRASYVVAEDGKAVVVFGDGRKVSPSGAKTEVVTAVPNDPQSTSYTIALPGRLFASPEKVQSGQPTYLMVEPSHDGSILTLRPVVKPNSQRGTSITLEGGMKGTQKAIAGDAVNIALVGPPSAVPSTNIISLRAATTAESRGLPAPSDPAAFPRAVDGGRVSVATGAAAPAAPIAIATTGGRAVAPRAATAASQPFTTKGQAVAPLAPRPGDRAHVSQAVAGRAPVLSEVPVIDYKYAKPQAAKGMTAPTRDPLTITQTAGGPVTTYNPLGDGKVALLADDVSLSQAVRDIVLQADISVLIEPGEYQRVTLFTRGLEPDEALILVVRAAKGSLRREGKNWIVSPRSVNTTPQAKNSGATERVADINFRDVAFPTAIENMSKLYGFNYSIDTDMGPISVSAKLDNANLQTALKAVCLNIVHYRLEDGTYHFSVLKG